MKEIINKIIDWKQRHQKLEAQAREIEKKLFDPNIDQTLDLGKIAKLLTLSARAIEIDICCFELIEILKKIKKE